jgi:aminodeoxyfutalosine synthase
MLYGHVETLQQRVDHLLALRQLQDETGGFQAMVPLRFHPRNTMLSHLRPATGGESLKVHAVARLLLDNVPNIKAFWIMQGVEVSQALLHAGVNDLDGTVSEERITHMAGARTPQGLSVARLHALIEEAGQRPVERDSRYRAVRRQGSDWSTAGALPEAACASAGACAHHVAP